MLTWRELWVCATYSNTAGVSLGSTGTKETSTGGFAGGGVSFLPQAPSRATPRTARGTIARGTRTGLEADIGNPLKAAPPFWTAGFEPCGLYGKCEARANAHPCSVAPPAAAEPERSGSSWSDLAGTCA